MLNAIISFPWFLISASYRFTRIHSHLVCWNPWICLVWRLTFHRYSQSLIGGWTRWSVIYEIKGIPGGICGEISAKALGGYWAIGGTERISSKGKGSLHCERNDLCEDGNNPMLLRQRSLHLTRGSPRLLGVSSEICQAKGPGMHSDLHHHRFDSKVCFFPHSMGWVCKIVICCHSWLNIYFFLYHTLVWTSLWLSLTSA